MPPPQRLDYPDHHIEADNRLSWFLGELDLRFGDDAHYVHLRRDPEAVAASYASRWPKHTMLHDAGIMGAYAHGIFHTTSWPVEQRLEMARSYTSTVTSNIELFLKDKSRVSEIWLETLPHDLARVWKEVGAIGDLDSAVRIASTTHNARPPRATIVDASIQVARRWYGYSRAISTDISRRSRSRRSGTPPEQKDY